MNKLKKLLFFLLSITLCICMLYFICYLLPAPKMDKSNEITFYDRNDNIILKTHYQNVGSYVEIGDINEYFILAFIAAEDENFYSHIGISLKGTLRAIYNNLVNNTTQGGSTITQQLSRSLYLDNEKTVYRKI
ncbi:MAG: transglycosylase domain-containing protein, partial [Erysipelotrichaceae bacterium]|nr:transglycosylase domain-containing protein [Erysipelotrichaceae bacterium]